jgi:glutamine synthetase
MESKTASSHTSQLTKTYMNYQALEEDHEYLTEGGVFSKELIENWIEYKRVNEIQELAARPHPYEFELYYGV